MVLIYVEINPLQGWIHGSHQPPYKLLSGRLYPMHFLSQLLKLEVETGLMCLSWLQLSGTAGLRVEKQALASVFLSTEMNLV